MTLSGHLKSKRFGGGLIDCKAVAFSVSRLRTDKFVPLAGTGGSDRGQSSFALGPTMLILFDHSEYNLYSISRSWGGVVAGSQFLFGCSRFLGRPAKSLTGPINSAVSSLDSFIF
jgi:hypothetical protein